MNVRQLFEGMDVLVPREGAGLRVCDLTEDSRTVMPGSLFVARKGLKADGRAFVAQAVEAGAVAVLTDDSELAVAGPAVRLIAVDLPTTVARMAERFYGGPSDKLTVIGVTGTNGKTTIAYLIHQMLNKLGIRCGLIGTVSIDDGVEVAPATHTTPPALEVSQILARMVDAGCKAAVMETSSHALDQKRVGAVRFAAGIFTNLTHDHLDYHKTMEAYGAAKATLFEMLQPGGVAVVNIMDPAHTRMVQGTRAGVIRCAIEGPLSTRTAGSGTAPDSIRSTRITGATTAYTDLELGGGWGRKAVRLPLIGAFNVMNALEALATVYALFGPGTEANRPFDELCGVLSSVHAPPGRLEPVTRPGDPISVLVDYAHTDDALRTVLGVVRDALRLQHETSGGPRPGKLWCVFGCGGDRDRTKRPKMGAITSELADHAVLTSDNPRTEDPMSIIGMVRAGIPPAAASRVIVEPDRERAIYFAVQSAAPGDAVLIAGKGHEDYQILPDPSQPGGTVRRHFDDREVARVALAARGVHLGGAEPKAAAGGEIPNGTSKKEVGLHSTTHKRLMRIQVRTQRT